MLPVDWRGGFNAAYGVHGFELWSLNPQETSPRRLTNFSDPQTHVFSVEKLGNRVAFATVDSHEETRVWTSRGDLRSTAPLAVTSPRFSSSCASTGSRCTR